MLHLQKSNSGKELFKKKNFLEWTPKDNFFKFRSRIGNLLFSKRKRISELSSSSKK